MANRLVSKDVSDNIIASSVMALSSMKNMGTKLLSYKDATNVTVGYTGCLIPVKMGDYWGLIDTATDVNLTTHIDTGSVAPSTAYYVYAAVTGGAITCVYSLSSSTPTGYTYYEKLGGFTTNGSSQVDSTTVWDVKTNLGLGATTDTILVGGGANMPPVATTATGTGAPVRATSPTLESPALGTPASGDLQNCTASTTSTKGVVLLSGNTKALAGTDTESAMTPADVKYVLDRYQPRENLIGIAGQAGFGVGICPLANLPSGMTPMAGYDVLGNDNYGNYQFTDGSIMCWIPKFYYKITTLAIDIKGIDTYATTALANAAGYALHRAFIDGGAEKNGFFVDKYICSKVANGAGYTAASIKNGLPLSSAAAHNPFSGLTGGADYYYSAIDLAHRRDGVDGAVNASSIFFCCSRFIYGALAMLSMAHGQAATSTTNCAWYHATYNYPKGCNNNALKDCDDTTVIWESDGYLNCGKTGSAGYGGGAGNVFAKSTHNGQNCGVADLNGLMYEIAIGVTCDGTDFYVAKQATAMKTFTNGDDAADTDHWGREAAGGMFDTFTIPFSGTGWQYFGSGANQVLSEVTSGNGWLLTGLGLPKDANGMDGTGTNLFGKDGFYRYTIDKLCLLACARWVSTTSAGVWCVHWNDARTASADYVGFRAACYPA